MKKSNIVPKTWGFEVQIINGQYAGKFLYVLRDHYSSIHCHRLKDESFFIFSGTIKLFWKNGAVRYLKPGDVVHIPPRVWHKFKAVGGNALILEISTHDDPEDTERRVTSIVGPLCKAPRDMEEFCTNWMHK